MASNIIGNRNSTPEASKSSLRPPQSRNTLGGSHQLRSSADMSGLSSSPLSSRDIRPSSEVLYNQQGQNNSELGEQWIQDIEQYETMLEEMAAATLDQDFKDELSAIEQWFRVLSEAERTAATYALIQQTTQMQQRFFAQVLNQMSKSHPISGVLSPANFGEKGMNSSPNHAMSSRLNDAMSKLNVEGSRNSFGRPPPSPGNKRNSGLDPSKINAMFPDAAAAIAQKKIEYQQQTGNLPPSNRNSAAFGAERNSLVTPTISAPVEPPKESNAQTSTNWRSGTDQPAPIARPKSSSGQQGPAPMGQFSAPPPSAGLRSPRALGTGSGNIQTTNLTAPENLNSDMPVLSPYQGGSWASMTNTPMVPTFNQQNPTQADMIANATAMKLAALSTVNNRLALDDPRKYRRARSPGDNPGVPNQPVIGNTGIPGVNTIVVDESGKVLNPQQIAALQAQQAAAMQGRRSRPNSPGLAMGNSLPQMGFASPQNNGFLAAYDGSSPLINNGLGGMMGQFGVGNVDHGYLSDQNDMHQRGRSPRGRRGSSKPPEDPTDINLLKDIPAWLRSLRLHKYTDNLKDLTWEQLVDLDDDGLSARGVNALGARNKMLKTFEQVREAREAGKLPP
ncbi:MAG: hypothetical protein Q9227_007279 [Pyrenula ochraceoflavens]